MQTGKLTLFCGKMGAGKTTKAKEIAQNQNAILLCEDDWLATLYPEEIQSLSDYVNYSNRLKLQIKPLIQSLLKKGLDVVLDFPANTIKQRVWLKSVIDEIDAGHELIFLDRTNKTCLAQIKQRNIEQPERAKTDTEAMFYQATEYFTAPSAEEGFNLTTFE